MFCCYKQLRMRVTPELYSLSILKNWSYNYNILILQKLRTDSIGAVTYVICFACLKNIWKFVHMFLLVKPCMIQVLGKTKIAKCNTLFLLKVALVFFIDVWILSDKLASLHKFVCPPFLFWKSVLTHSVSYRFGKANILKQLEVTLLGFLKPIQNRY